MYRTRSLYTTAGFQVQQNLHWEMLTDDQCEALVDHTIELLERTGVEVQSPEAVKAFAAAGCYVEGTRVRIPTVKSEWAIRVSPTRVTLCDRDGKRAIMMENNHVHYGPGYTSQDYIDQKTGDERPFVIGDVEEFGKLCEMLPNIDFAMSGGYPTDVPAGSAEVHEFARLLETTRKPIVQNVKSVAQAKAAYEMACAVVGSVEKLRVDPLFALQVTTAEPLMLSAEALDVIMFAAENGIPVVFSNELVSGDTAPAESAGVMIVALANSLAALILSQLVSEGAPFITGGFFTNNDTVNGLHPYGSPEVSLLGAGFASILRYMRVPSFGFAGATDSKTSDAQLGLECAMSVLHAGLAGTNLIYGAGIMESGCAANPALLVLTDEIAAETRRIMRGVEMDEDRLARGVIDEVKPGGNYLATKHTRFYFRTEQFWPTLMNRRRIDDWSRDGSLTLGDRTVAKTEQLLASYELAPLSAEVIDELKKIVDKADAAR